MGREGARLKPHLDPSSAAEDINVCYIVGKAGNGERIAMLKCALYNTFCVAFQTYTLLG